ncbi:MAG: Spy/CpxP family protein refolding chaperone [Polaromonas sp.]
MKFALNTVNRLVLAGLLASAGFSVAIAQAPITAPINAPATAASAAADGKSSADHGGHPMMGRHDPAKMQAWMAKRQAELKAKLKITASQEAAWTSFTAAMPPSEHRMGQRPSAEQRAELDKLTTPERIDKMRAIRTERMADRTAAMDKRGAAIKTFYATLSPEQQKTFDAEHRKMGRHEGRRGARHESGMHNS